MDALPEDYLDVNEPQIKDILMRHNTLVETYQDLIKIVQQHADDIEAKQQQLVELSKDKNDAILVSNSQLGNSQKRLDKLRHETTNTEIRLQEVDNRHKQQVGCVPDST